MSLSNLVNYKTTYAFVQMKLLFLSTLLVVPFIGTSQISIHTFFERTNAFLETHTHEGRVNYPAIVNNNTELNS